jgi:hypothetical protein
MVILVAAPRVPLLRWRCSNRERRQKKSVQLDGDVERSQKQQPEVTAPQEEAVDPPASRPGDLLLEKLDALLKLRMFE